MVQLSTGLPSCSLLAYLHALYRPTFMLCTGIPSCYVPAYRHALCRHTAMLSALSPLSYPVTGPLGAIFAADYYSCI